MADIIPFRGWRYNEELSADIDTLLSPPFDVVTPKQREQLYGRYYNSIHLSVPQYSINNTARYWDSWVQQGAIEQEDQPSIYIYYQYFRLPGSTEVLVRKGFICLIKAYEWNENVVLRHEDTIPHAVGERLSLLQQVGVQASPTHGLYTDASHKLEAYMDACMEEPVYQVEDYQGVSDALGIISNPETIKRFIQVIQNKQIILADGHHRYQGAISYRQERLIQEPGNTNALFNYHMMYLTNTESKDLRILPTHRTFTGIQLHSRSVEKMQQHFTLHEIDNPEDIPEIIYGKQYTFGMITKDRAFILKLKPSAINAQFWNLPDSVRRLDVTLIHYFLVEQILDISREQQPCSPVINYERNFTSCLNRVSSGKVSLAIILNELDIEQIKEVCYSGNVLPQKSTFFFPKVICGFVFGEINPNHE